ATCVDSRSTASTRSSERSSMLPPSIKDDSASSMALLAGSERVIIIDRNEVAVRVALDAGDLRRPRRFALDGRRLMQQPHCTSDLLGKLGRHRSGLGHAFA